MSTDLAVIEAALKAATPGPWETWPHTHLEDGCRCLSCQFVTVWQTRNGIDCEDVARKPGESERCEAAGYSWEDANLIANAPAWLAELVERVKVAEGVLRDFADHGTRHDTTPTVPMDGSGPARTGGWYGYLLEMDQYVRRTAARALGAYRVGSGEVTRFTSANSAPPVLAPTPPFCERCGGRSAEGV